MMPVMRFGFCFEPAVAVGTTLTAVFFTAASGALQHVKMKNVEKKTAQIIACSGALGIVIGSMVFSYIKNYGKVLDMLLGFIFFLVALRMIYEGILLKKHPAVLKNKISEKKITKGLLGSLVGFLTGIVGLGGGYLLVPSFVFLKMPLPLAIGTSMASFVWIVLMGALWKIYQGTVNFSAAFSIGLGASIGAIYGARLVAKFKPNILKTVFGLFFLYVSLKYVFL